MKFSTLWNKMPQEEKLKNLKNVNAWGYENWNSIATWNELTPHVQGLLLSQKKMKKMICCNCNKERKYDESGMCEQCWCKSLHQGKPCLCNHVEMFNK